MTKEKCTGCNGSGSVLLFENNIEPCETCCGSGYIEIEECVSEKIKKLQEENERLNNICKEFIYFEDNPHEYKLKEEEITQLQADLNKAKEIILFYGNKDNWQDFRTSAHGAPDIESTKAPEEDIEIDGWNSYGGKKAREFAKAMGWL